jgi:NAD(P)-dependent dehydrogenase (short-subunit alcohol dehydrogenase family)
VRDLEGSVAVVTGAAAGIGRELVIDLARRGMRVAAADIDAAAIGSLVDELRAQGSEAIAIASDVSDADQVEELAETVVRTFGGVHLLCNNAAISSNFGRQWEIPVEEWRRVIEVDLLGVVHGIRSFVPRILATGAPGHIVNVASFGGLVSPPLRGPYTAAKHGVVGLTKALRAELADSRIGVTLVCPGSIDTGILGRTKSHYESPELQRIHGRTAAMLKDGMTVGDAVKIIVDAVVAGRFWALPNVGAEAIGTVLRDAGAITSDWT